MTTFFRKKQTCLTTVYAAHVPSGFLCLNDKKTDDIKLFKNHSIAVGLWARPPCCCLRFHKPVSVHPR